MSLILPGMRVSSFVFVIHCMHVCFSILSVSVPRPAITVSVISEGSDTAGNSYVLTCTVMEEVEGLSNMPSLQWLDPSDQVVANGEGVTVGQIQQTDITGMLILTFDPVRTSHGGEYTCQGTLKSPPGPLMNTSEQIVTVQSKCIVVYGSILLGEFRTD